EGWLVVVPDDRRAAARRATLGPDGSLRTTLVPFDDGHALADGDLTDTFVHHPSAATFAHVFQEPGTDTTMYVQILDERGGPLRAFEDDAPGWGGAVSPSVVFTDDGRLLVAWHDLAPDSTRNHVYVRELGCPP